MVQTFTGGDMSLLPQLLDFNADKSDWDPQTAAKQAEVDDYLGAILIIYFQTNSLSIPPLEG